jgi:uncharacterized protein (TIGR03084 family)
MDKICDDLEAETAALKAVVGELTEEQWRAPTVAEGWDSHETVLHLGAADLIAHLTLTDRPSFQTAMGKLSSGDASLNQLAGQDVSALSGRELWQWFLLGRQAMIDALRLLGPKDRIAWIGPEIGARSMATGRLMETWTHSHDLADTFGVAYPQTDRLRNIAHLGVVTRDFSYVNQCGSNSLDPMETSGRGAPPTLPTALSPTRTNSARCSRVDNRSPPR